MQELDKNILQNLQYMLYESNLYIQCCHGTCLRYAWNIWDIIWDILGHSMGQSQNVWDIKNVQHCYIQCFHQMGNIIQLNVTANVSMLIHSD